MPLCFLQSLSRFPFFTHSPSLLISPHTIPLPTFATSAIAIPLVKMSMQYPESQPESQSEPQPQPPAQILLAADLTKWTVCLIVSVLLLSNPSTTTILSILGACFNSLSAKVLKAVIRQPRPTSQKSDPGMPSSHAASLSFLSLLFAIQATGGAIWIDLMAIMGVLVAGVASWWRVRVGYHTGAQVIGGWILGGGNALVWGLGVVPGIWESVEGSLEWGVGRMGVVAGVIVVGLDDFVAFYSREWKECGGNLLTVILIYLICAFALVLRRWRWRWR